MALFQPLRVGSLTLKNRVLMAPLTRCRASEDTHIPSDMMVEHYAARASGGLLIAEATMVAPKQSAFWTEPVHAKGGLIALQIWHGGRAAVPINSDGEPNVGPSAIGIPNRVGEQLNRTLTKIEHAVPRELTDEEISEIVAQFAQAAKNAIEAGFDAVEIHGANGYLIDNFWRSSSNQRKSGPYSGATIETRSKFLLDVVKAVAGAIGKDKVGIRLSPLNSHNGQKDEDPIALLRYTLAQLNEIGIAFVEIMRADLYHAQTGDVLTPAREVFKGVLIANMWYDGEEAEAAIASGAIDAVAFGTKFLANPDLPFRLQTKAPLNAPRPEHFYSHVYEGYNDYPALSA